MSHTNKGYSSKQGVFMKENKMLKWAISTAVALGLNSGAALSADKPKMVLSNQKCYGIAKAGKNDCGTAVHACSSEATKDANPEDWIYLPAGVCDKIVGASTKAPKK